MELDQKYQAHYNYLLGWANKGDNKFSEAVSFLKTSIENDKYNKYKDKVSFLINEIEDELIKLAVKEEGLENYTISSKYLYDAYMINPENERYHQYLFLSAGTAIKNSDNYDIALEYSLALKNMNYSGIETEYFITPVDTNIEEKVSEKEYNIFKTLKDYTNPRINKTDSKYPDVLAYISFIYTKTGKYDLAISEIEEARKIRPDDINLIMKEASLYASLDNKVKFEALMEEAILKDPNNFSPYYNVGVIRSEQGLNDDKTKNYYLKAIELNESYVNSYINLVVLILKEESVLNEALSNLNKKARLSNAEAAQYKSYEEQKLDVYKECIPYLKKLIEIDPTNIFAYKQLKGLYYGLDDEESMKLMTAKIQELENQ